MLIFFRRVLTCTVFCHHISHYVSLCHSQIFYIFIDFRISCFNLLDLGKYSFWLNHLYLQRRIADRIRSGRFHLTATSLRRLPMRFVDSQIIRTATSTEQGCWNREEDD